MTVEYNYKGYTLVWSDGNIPDDDIGSWIIFDKYEKPLVRATTNGVPPTEEQAREIIEATLKALHKYLNQALLFSKAKKKPIKGNILDLKLESDEE